MLALTYQAPKPCTVCLVRPVVARVYSAHVPPTAGGAWVLVTFRVVHGEPSVLEVHTTEAIAEYEPDTYTDEATNAEECRIGFVHPLRPPPQALELRLRALGGL